MPLKFKKSNSFVVVSTCVLGVKANSFLVGGQRFSIMSSGRVGIPHSLSLLNKKRPDHFADTLCNLIKCYIIVVPKGICDRSCIRWKSLKLTKWFSLPVDMTENNRNDMTFSSFVSL